MCSTAVETSFWFVYLVCCVFEAFVLVCVSLNVLVSADHTHHLLLTFNNVHGGGEGCVNENSEGSNMCMPCVCVQENRRVGKWCRFN